MFKTWDKVKCIKESTYGHAWVIGNIYEVLRVDNYWVDFVTTEDCKESSSNACDRFELVIVKQPKRKTHTYETTHTRSDWVVFTETRIDWELLETYEEEKELAKATIKRVTGLMKSHNHLFWKKKLNEN